MILFFRFSSFFNTTHILKSEWERFSKNCYANAGKDNKINFLSYEKCKHYPWGNHAGKRSYIVSMTKNVTKINGERFQNLLQGKKPSHNHQDEKTAFHQQ